ncbi:hypothetical protein ACFX13_038004 [Malus domestica]|uniref:calvin cycle protein CP12-3, chloroplastic n=1 Tax=Malus domestica TaxID=3750 RepID=UPI0021ACC204|nr:calvin cycle protein CP12-3, chloroplastic [Malus sylvestris]
MACVPSGVGTGRGYLTKMKDLSATASVSLRSLDLGGGRGRRRMRGVMVAMAVQGRFKGTQMREKQLTEMIEKKVVEATEVCEGDPKTDECKVAWDEVEEVSQAKADLRLKLEKHKDPLESFCQENPETDECRIYED